VLCPPVVLGVLAMVFGALLGLWEGGSLALSSFGAQTSEAMLKMAETARRPDQPDPSETFAKATALRRELRPVQDTMAAGKLVLSLALVVIGFGLYRRARWARTAALGWSALGLLFLGGEVWTQLTLIVPRMQRLQLEMLSSQSVQLPGASAFVQATGTIAVVTLLVFLAPFPVVLLGLLGRPSARADFVD
jgi:hypothetical protein